MTDKHIISLSIAHAFGVAAYTALVAWFMTNANSWLGKAQGFWGPAAFLLLFVFSAAVVGALVLGRPVMLYLNGAKTEAVKFFSATVGWLLMFLVIAIVLAVWMQ